MRPQQDRVDRVIAEMSLPLDAPWERSIAIQDAWIQVVYCEGLLVGALVTWRGEVRPDVDEIDSAVDLLLGDPVAQEQWPDRLVTIREACSLLTRDTGERRLSGEQG